MGLTETKKIVAGIITWLIPYISTALPDYHPQDSIHAVELFRNAVEYGRNGDPVMALETFEKSLHYRKKVFGEKHYRLGSTYMGMAIQYKNLFQLDNAYRNYQIAEEMYLFNAPENDSRLGDIYTNMGNYFRLKGNMGEAIRYHERALFIYEHSPDKIPEENYLAVVYNLADSYHQVNREEEALQLALRNGRKGSIQSQIKYMNLQASIYSSSGNRGKAGSIYRSIIERLSQSEEADALSLADQFLYYAQFLNQISEKDAALAYLLRAGEIYQRYPHMQANLGDLYSLIADAWTGKNVEASNFADFQSQKTANLLTAVQNYLKALDYLNETGETIQMSYTLFSESNFPVQTLRILRDLGLAYHQLAGLTGNERKESMQDYLCKAINCFTTGSDLAENLRTGYVSEESKVQFTVLQQEIFKLVIRGAYDLHQLTNEEKWAEIALYHSERNKAVSLFDKINETKSRVFSTIPDSLIRIESQCNSNLAYYREKLYDEMHLDEPDPGKIADIKTNIFNNEQNINRLRENMEKNYPEYFQMKYSRDPLTFSTFRKKLKRNEVLLSYVVDPQGKDGAGSLYIFVVSKNGYRFTRQPFTEETIAHISKLYAVVSSTDFLNIDTRDFKAYCEAACYLNEKLISPYREMLKDKRVILIPDGILNYLPFEALLTEKEDDHSVHFHDLPYLIYDLTINYAYSAELIKASDKKQRIKRKRVLAFAPVMALTGILNNETVDLPALPGTLDEVNYIRKKIKTDAFLREEATERNFREHAEDYQILHLAMHTLINDSVPLFSKLGFSPGDTDSMENDGWINTSDIYNLKLNARMAVLSACRSGGGKLLQGEGIMSLARSFFYAGCPSVVLSLWEVEDRSGTEIMKTFYQNLKYGKTKDTALRNAKLKHIRNADPMTAHPHLWLCYITTGDPEPLFNGIDKILLAIMGLILAGLVIDLVVRKSPRKTTE